MVLCEKDLDRSASYYSPIICKGWRSLLNRKVLHLYNKVKPYFKGDRVLEIGSGEGLFTELLVGDFKEVDVLEGSSFFINFLKKKKWAERIHFISSMLEEYTPQKKYPVVFFTHVLEHVDHPIEALMKLKECILPDGIIILAVPNAFSFHRLVGVEMNMLETCDSLNEQDRLLGHRRVYTPELFKEHIREASLKIIEFGGCMLKPISNRQIEAQWSSELIEGFFKLGDQFPEHCAEIYAVVGK